MTAAMDETLPSPDRAAAEDLFAQRLADLEDGVPGVIEELCAEHQEHAGVFLELFEDWRRVRELFDAGAAGPMELSVDLGKLVEGVVEGKGSAEGDEADSEVVRRLKERLDPASRLEVQGEMARGGMGAVLSVFDKNLRRQMAMKVMLKQDQPGKPVQSRAMGRFLDEAQITGQLEHPGIVPVHELGIEPNGRVYFTMKLVQGEELADVYRRAWAGEDDWSVTRVLGIFLRVCEAMAYAHARGVIHRDLKPANVMVGAFGEVYVMDWGLARIRGKEDHAAEELVPADGSGIVRSDRQDMRDRVPDSSILTRQGDIMGTPAYMSPEQAGGEIAAMDERSDVYSVGAMLYELLAGGKPYTTPAGRPDLVTLLGRIREGPPPPIHELQPDVVPELEAICEKAMRRDKQERYADMGELGKDLRSFLEGRVVGAYETGAVAELRKWVRRNRGLANALVAGVLVLVAGVVVSSYYWLESSQQTKNVLRLADSRDLSRLWEEGRELWPAHPENAERLRTWVGRAEQILGRLPEHEATLVALRGDARALTPEEVEWDRTGHAEAVGLIAAIAQYRSVIARIEEFIASQPSAEEVEHWTKMSGEYVAAIDSLESLLWERRTYTFLDDDKDWWHEALVQLIADLGVLKDEALWYVEEGSGRYVCGVDEIRERLEFADEVDERSMTGEDARGLWGEALRSIADTEECPMYGGLELMAQRGLLPIGRDPHSGLWEFSHLQTGRVAVRDAESGELEIRGGTGLVFVLIPGGSFQMGAQAGDSEAPNHDPDADSNEGPVHEVSLASFFLSKYEMSQGQWMEASGRNPSKYKADRDRVEHPETGELITQITKTHPVETVTWRECEYLTRTQGLVLPTEAQWEYAARAGTTTPWWTGASGASLQGAENIGDSSTKLIGLPAWICEEWDDGFPAHAPVDSLRPNPWGMHQILGNVGEWIGEVHIDGYPEDARGKDGRQADADPGPLDRDCTIRGPGWFRPAVGCRVSARYSADPSDYKTEHFGLRPARAIEP
jgi:formylglycine-generating enzyme required for sulfatase activity